jgi:copper chaperone CopZ
VLARNQRGGRHSPAGLLLAGAFAFIFAGACDDRGTRVSNPNADLKVVEIPVEGMTCAACAVRVKRALTSREGVSDAEVSLAERRARVRFDPRASPARRKPRAADGDSRWRPRSSRGSFST